MKPSETIQLKITKEFTTTIDVYKSHDKKSKKVIVFSHGFGVDKTDKGLFTDVMSVLLPEYSCIMFNYTEIRGKDLYSPGFSTMLDTFQAVIAFMESKFSGNEITLIAHSLGAVIATMSKYKKWGKSLFIANSPIDPYAKIVTYFGGKKDSKINYDGDSRLKRSDGTYLIVSKEFWAEFKQLDLLKGYKEFDKVYKDNGLYVRASQDEIISPSEYEALPFQFDIIDANHNFTNRGRLNLLRYISKKFLTPERGIYFKVILLPYEDGKVFVQDRSNYKFPPIGFWGGSIEKGESNEQALIREVKEELNIDIKKEVLEYLGQSINYISVGTEAKISYDDVVMIHEVFTCDMGILNGYEVLEGAKGLFLDTAEVKKSLMSYMNDMLVPFWKYWENK